MGKKAERNSAIELLRIIAMVMIVFHHFAVHGGFVWTQGDVTVPHLWYNMIMMGGQVGVDVFVLISGYFLISDEGPCFNPRRILKFWGPIFFYSVLFYLIFGLAGQNTMSLRSFLIDCLPITYQRWWFASTYFVLYLFHPFLNRMLRNLTRQEYRALLMISLILWSVIPTILKQAMEGNLLLWFIVLYALAGYVKIYGPTESPAYARSRSGEHTAGLLQQKAGLWFVLFFASSALTYAASVVLTILGANSEACFNYSTYLFEGRNMIPVLAMAFTLFMAFSGLKMTYHRWINVIASATFGVYLIHDNYLVRYFLWEDVFRNAAFQNTRWIIPYSIAAVLIVYAACTAIDLVRQRCFAVLTGSRRASGPLSPDNSARDTRRSRTGRE